MSFADTLFRVQAAMTHAARRRRLTVEIKQSDLSELLTNRSHLDALHREAPGESGELKALRETQEALNVTQCPWCGAWGADYAESERPPAYCHHEYTLTPWRCFAKLEATK